MLAIIDGRPGPFIDGRRYHTDEFLEVAEDYHRRIVEAHKGRGVEQLTLPVLPGLSIQEPVELVNSFRRPSSSDSLISGAPTFA